MFITTAPYQGAVAYYSCFSNFAVIINFFISLSIMYLYMYCAVYYLKSLWIFQKEDMEKVKGWLGLIMVNNFSVLLPFHSAVILSLFN